MTLDRSREGVNVNQSIQKCLVHFQNMEGDICDKSFSQIKRNICDTLNYGFNADNGCIQIL